MPKIKRNENGLTPKQQAFVDVYDGDLQRSAAMANISYAYARQLVANLQTHANKDNAIAVRKAIRERDSAKVASRQDRQRLWTEMMQDEARDDSTRLKASELLAKSELDFGDSSVNIQIASVADIFAKVGGRREIPCSEAPALPALADQGSKHPQLQADNSDQLDVQLTE